ncbi:MAG: polyhydroxyalkanoate synthesis repressor PhaR [Geminicoccaceae bacterium]|nr:polyhydroxyalkanoate synthesis repressor PhaR [Geminicoccaceae bacterium]
MASADDKPKRGDESSNVVAVVKKYANRRLYNTATSSYVTLDELSQMVRQGDEFVVYDAKSGDDITRSVLTQIILEEDSKGRNLLPISFLRQLIAFYDDSLHAIVPRYLEVSMENFARHQDQMRSYVEDTIGRFFPVPGMDRSAKPFEDLTRQNLAMMQNAARMFSPFADPKDETQDSTGETTSSGENDSQKEVLSNEMKELKAQLTDLQHQLDALARKNKE